jgi:hypothetical protein
LRHGIKNVQGPDKQELSFTCWVHLVESNMMQTASGGCTMGADRALGQRGRV